MKSSLMNWKRLKLREIRNPDIEASINNECKKAEMCIRDRDSNPDVIYGRDFEGEPVALETITGEMGEVIVRGQVMEVEAREIRKMCIRDSI